MSDQLTLLERLLNKLEALAPPTQADLMLHDHPGKRITIDHIARARTATERGLLIAWRFPWLYREEVLGSKLPETLADIQKLEKKLLAASTGEVEAASLSEGETAENQSGVGAKVDPIEADLAKLRAVPREQLTHRNGTLNKSAVARALGYSTGGGNWDYVGEVTAHYQAEIDEADQLDWENETETEASTQKQEAA